jgi:hypothetical protein
VRLGVEDGLWFKRRFNVRIRGRFAFEFVCVWSHLRGGADVN